MSDGRIRAWIALASAERMGAPQIHQLLSAFGSAEAVVAATPASLARYVPLDVAHAIRDGGDAASVESVMSWCTEAGNYLLAWDDPRYPKALLQIPDPPPLLY